jgi:hypothetical protein
MPNPDDTLMDCEFYGRLNPLKGSDSELVNELLDPPPTFNEPLQKNYKWMGTANQPWQWEKLPDVEPRSVIDAKNATDVYPDGLFNFFGRVTYEFPDKISYGMRIRYIEHWEPLILLKTRLLLKSG